MKSKFPSFVRVRQTEEAIKDSEIVLQARKEENQKLKSYFTRTGNELKTIN